MSETYTLLHFTLNLQNNWYILIYSINWYCYFSDSDFHKFDQHFRNWVTMVYIFLHLHVSSVLFSYCWRSLNYNLQLSNEMNKLTATFYLCYNWLKLKTICCGKKICSSKIWLLLSCNHFTQSGGCGSNEFLIEFLCKF